MAVNSALPTHQRKGHDANVELKLPTGDLARAEVVSGSEPLPNEST